MSLVVLLAITAIQSNGKMEMIRPIISRAWVIMRCVRVEYCCVIVSMLLLYDDPRHGGNQAGLSGKRPYDRHDPRQAHRFLPLGPLYNVPVNKSADQQNDRDHPAERRAITIMEGGK